MKLNHLLLQTRDMNAMTAFFTKVIGLEHGFRPPFPFKGAWLYGDKEALIHLVETPLESTAQTEHLGFNTGEGPGLVDHIALQGADYKRLIDLLRQYGIEYSERTVPLTQEHQVFIQGPEGLKIEMVFAKDKTTLQ